MNEYEIFKKINGLHVTLPLDVIKKIEGVEAAAFLQQCVFLSSICEKTDGWFFLNQVDPIDNDPEQAEGDAEMLKVFQRFKSFENSLKITKHSQNLIRKKLREIGLLEEKQMGLPKRNYYKVDLKKYMEWLSSPIDSTDVCFQTSRSSESENKKSENERQEVKNMNVKKAEIERDTNINTITSKTTKTTTTNTASLVDGSSVSIEIPSNLQNYAEQIVNLTSCLESALAQKVIDELSAGMADSSIKSPMGWLSNVVKKAQAGEFIESKSIKFRDAKKKEAENKANVASGYVEHLRQVKAVVVPEGELAQVALQEWLKKSNRDLSFR